MAAQTLTDAECTRLLWTATRNLQPSPAQGDRLTALREALADVIVRRQGKGFPTLDTVPAGERADVDGGNLALAECAAITKTANAPETPVAPAAPGGAVPQQKDFTHAVIWKKGDDNRPASDAPVGFVGRTKALPEVIGPVLHDGAKQPLFLFLYETKDLQEARFLLDEADDGGLYPKDLRGALLGIDGGIAATRPHGVWASVLLVLGIALFLWGLVSIRYTGEAVSAMFTQAQGADATSLAPLEKNNLVPDAGTMPLEGHLLGDCVAILREPRVEGGAQLPNATIRGLCQQAMAVGACMVEFPEPPDATRDAIEKRRACIVDPKQRLSGLTAYADGSPFLGLTVMPGTVDPKQPAFQTQTRNSATAETAKNAPKTDAATTDAATTDAAAKPEGGEAGKTEAGKTEAGKTQPAPPPAARGSPEQRTDRPPSPNTLATVSVSLYGAFLKVMLGIVVMLVGIGFATKGRWIGVLIDERNRLSLTRAQLAAWTVILLGGYTVLAYWNVSLLAVYARDHAQTSDAFTNLTLYPRMDVYLWALLGLVLGTPYASALILDPKREVQPDKVAPPLAEGAPSTNQGLLAGHGDPAQAGLLDLVTGEEATNRNRADVSRVQTVVITILLMATYVQFLSAYVQQIDMDAVVRALADGKPVFAQMPAIDASFVGLLFASHAALLAFKTLPKPAPADGVPPAA